MTVGSSLLAVCGKTVKSHQEAIQLLEAEVRSETSLTFEVVVREPAAHFTSPVVQRL